MRSSPLFALFALAFLIPCLAPAASSNGLRVEVLVNNSSLAEHRHQGSTYVEASKGASYSIRLTNTQPLRIGVALAVDGRNTIDGSHTTAKAARKWVLDPYESVVIPGWQTSTKEARSFFFTTEDHSYAAALGDASNAGVIEAVAFREVQALPPEIYTDNDWRYEDAPMRDRAAAGAGARTPSAAPVEQSRSSSRKSRGAADSNRSQRESAQAQESDDYAATGMGNRRSNRVQQVSLELEEYASASVRIRYGFHDELVSLGVLPDRRVQQRREQAQGFADFCPVP